MCGSDACVWRHSHATQVCTEAYGIASDVVVSGDPKVRGPHGAARHSVCARHGVSDTLCPTRCVRHDCVCDTPVCVARMRPPQVTIPYIPAHADYMLYELLKNAMR
jgi:hypothetical protein